MIMDNAGSLDVVNFLLRCSLALPELPATGVELLAKTPAKPAIGPESAAKCAAMPADPELARLVAAWPGLSDEQRLALLNLLDAVK